MLNNEMIETEKEIIELVEMEVDGIIYGIPSTFKYICTEHDNEGGTDIFEHEVIKEIRLLIKRICLTKSADSPSDALTILQARASDVKGKQSKPRLLVTGFAIMSYEEEVENDPELVRLCCELCGFENSDNLWVVLYSSVILKSLYKEHPLVMFYAHYIRRYAQLTRLATSKQPPHALQQAFCLEFSTPPALIPQDEIKT